MWISAHHIRTQVSSGTAPSQRRPRGTASSIPSTSPGHWNPSRASLSAWLEYHHTRIGPTSTPVDKPYLTKSLLVSYLKPAKSVFLSVIPFLSSVNYLTNIPLCENTLDVPKLWRSWNVFKIIGCVNKPYPPLANWSDLENMSSFTWDTNPCWYFKLKFPYVRKPIAGFSFHGESMSWSFVSGITCKH